MKQNFFVKRAGRRKKKSVRFNPSREYLENAIRDYIEKGGKIKKIENELEEYDMFINRYRSRGLEDIDNYD